MNVSPPKQTLDKIKVYDILHAHIRASGRPKKISITFLLVLVRCKRWLFHVVDLQNDGPVRFERHTILQCSVHTNVGDIDVNILPDMTKI